MIGKIKGTLTEIHGNRGLIETVSGVFYEVYLPPLFLGGQHTGQAFELYTYLHVKEDGLTLYGFEDRTQHDLFKLLITVSGVGPKLAFTLISFAKEDVLRDMIQKNDVTGLSKIPGLGKKTAMKIIVELSSKVDEQAISSRGALSDSDQTVVDALVALGFRVSDAKAAVDKLDSSLSVEEKIREALKEIK